MSATFDLINTDSWPILHVVIQDAPKQNEEIDMFQAKFIALLQLAREGGDGIAPEKIIILMDMDGMLNATWEQQVRAASFISEVREYVKNTIYCTALIVRNNLVRLVLDCVLKMQPLQSSHQIFDDSAVAMEWCKTNRQRQLRGEEPLQTA